MCAWCLLCVIAVLLSVSVEGTTFLLRNDIIYNRFYIIENTFAIDYLSNSNASLILLTASINFSLLVA